MKILAVGDVESKYIWNHFDKKSLGDIDVVLSTGDLNPDYLSYVASMTNAPLFYVPGNHDFYQKSPQGCINLHKSVKLFKSVSIAGLGGCREYSKGMFQYTEKKMRYFSYLLEAKICFKKGLDILITHSPLMGIGDGQDVCHKGFKAFYRLIDRYKPKYFIHGHHHLTYSQHPRIFSYKTTLIINSFDHFVFDYDKLYSKYFG